jgi:hypothetical protein
MSSALSNSDYVSFEHFTNELGGADDCEPLRDPLFSAKTDDLYLVLAGD